MWRGGKQGAGKGAVGPHAGRENGKQLPGSETAGSENTHAHDDGRKDDKSPRRVPEPASLLSYWTLYRYCRPLDWFLVIVGTLGAMAGGASMPVFTIILGRVINTFGQATSTHELVKELYSLIIWFVILAVVAAVTNGIEIYCWMVLGIRQSNIIREKYLKAVMRQEVGFFDTQATSGGLIETLNEDTAGIQEGMGDKIATFIHNVSGAVAAVVIGFWRAWDIFVVLIASFPALVLAGLLSAKGMQWLRNSTEKAYAGANGVAQESFSNIRVVAAYGGEGVQHTTYSRLLSSVKRIVPILSLVDGLAIGIFQFCIFSTYALTFYWGGILVSEGKRTGGDVINCMMAAMFGGMSLGHAAPYLRYFKNAQISGTRIFRIIDRKMAIDPDAPGDTLSRIQGEIDFRNVVFRYPARPDVRVFDSLNLHAEPGKTLALVGSSGSGKSTVVALVMRWYDVLDGGVYLDGVDIRNLQLRWLRSQMGLVAQEPALFATTIRENIMYGREGASQQQVEEAAKAANAHDFIMKLPDGYDTQVGERGTQLSGGQKQRIAIARAVLRNPPILLLDEATSALDTKSERQVQEALEQLMTSGRTTLVIAHRLSTIKNADKIAVMQEGRLVEEGTHEELAGTYGSVYGELVALQKKAEEEAKKKSQGGSFFFNASVNGGEKTITGRQRTAGDVEDKNMSEKDMGVEKDKPVHVSFRRLLAMNRPEIPVFLTGVVFTFAAGSMMPAMSYMLSSVLTDLFARDPHVVRTRSQHWALVMFVLALIGITSVTLQQGSFFYMGQQLAYRLKLAYFKAVLGQEVAFFDRAENNSGALVASLGRDTGYVKGAVGDQVGLILQNLTVVGASWTLALIFSWKLALVMIACVPVMASANMVRGKFMRTGLGDDASEMFAKANSVAMDAFGNIGIIAGFSLDGAIVALFQRYASGPTAQALRKSILASLAWAFSNGVMFLFYALSWWWAGQIMERDNTSLLHIFRAFFAVLLGNVGLMQAMLGFPDVGKSRGAIQRIFSAIDRQPPIQSYDPNGDTMQQVAGVLELRGVDFCYPTRPYVKVFNNFSLVFPAGRQTAIVGQSGSGKSTVVALVLRFYDPVHGSVMLDGRDIRDLNLAWLRRQMGLVAQEPTLFATTIRQNILFGREDATEEETIAAAKAANAWEFISQQPQGLDTEVGERGTQLSGGQKQRIAIARAVLRNPRILLLDEATSALDTKSERVVQDAIDRLVGGRTTIVIAHRLSTIVGADKIAVVQDGVMVEEGTHRQLLARNGAYANLAKMQLA